MAMATTKFQFKSISLPPRTHPSTSRLEQELTKLKTLEINISSTTTTPTSICNALSGLEDMFTQVQDLLNMGSTQQVLSLNRHKKCFNELLDESVKLLDVCGSLIDMMVQVKEYVQSLQSLLRRRKTDSCIESKVADYVCFRKTMKKSAKKLIATLKQMENKVGSLVLVDQDNHHLAAAIRVLREVNTMISSVFQYVLMFLSTPVTKSKQCRGWLLVSKLTRKAVTACEEKQAKLSTPSNRIQVIFQQNDLQVIDAALFECSGSDRPQAAQRKLEEFEISIKEIENCLESVFRCLIKARVTFLNIISQ